MTVDHVPVTWGSPQSRTSDVDGFRVVSARFPPGASLPSHSHDRATVAVVLRGSFEESVRGSTQGCATATVLMEPAGEPHGNRFEARGADVLIVQPDPACREMLDPFVRILDRGGHLRDPGVAGLAARVAVELRDADEVTPLAVTGLVLEMLARTARVDIAAAAAGRPPAWLTQARDLLHDSWREPLRVSDIAHAVGVHPVHLSRSFRAEYGLPVSGYVRRLRVEWAARRLTDTDEPIASIAVQAGFTDQSHLTRTLRAQLGVTPRQWRERSRS